MPFEEDYWLKIAEENVATAKDSLIERACLLEHHPEVPINTAISLIASAVKVLDIMEADLEDRRKGTPSA